ncbi:hypothetical protein Tco_0704372 [Tanacetum coccineum]|uniref:Uncharacterized protein n=1 Tax=Tanacetum coccineum TaxID=301880 RepID=A0ABQ4Y1V9_9ASTR
MIRMLQNIDREDLETLWKLVKAKHRNTRPEKGYERVLWGNLKVMFEPDVESEIWRNLQVSAAGTKVNAVGMKVTTAERLQLLEEFLLSVDIRTTNKIILRHCTGNTQDGIDEELSSGDDLNDWLNTEMERRMCGHDKEGEEDALVTILKSLVAMNIDSSSNSKGIAAIVSKLDSLCRDMKKLKENVHAI